MKYTIQLILLLLFSTFSAYSQSIQRTHERPLVVVVCSYNNEAWSENTLNSIFTQNYSSFRVIIVDDCSTDNNAEVIQSYIDTHNLHDRVTFIKNTARHRKLFNLYRVLYDCSDDEIVIMVDGDDYLAHKDVFSYINSFYDDPNVWFTYGQYRNVPAKEAIKWGFKEMGYCRKVPSHIQRKHDYRTYSFIYMHPRSFRAWLFKLVKLEDLIADNITDFEGNFYPAANDVAMYLPMVEMAHTRIRFIPDVLYIRNLYSNLVGFKVDRKIQVSSSREIRKKNPYPIVFAEKKNRLMNIQEAKADIFLLSKDSLKHIETTINNIQENSTGISTIYVFFYNTPDNKKLCRILSQQLENVVFIPYDIDGGKTLKNRMLEYLNMSKNNHIYVTTDKHTITGNLNFPQYIFWLEKTYAARFYLNRNRDNRDVNAYIPLTEEIYAWKIKNPGKGTTSKEDVFLCQKSKLYLDINGAEFADVSTFLKVMHNHKSLKSKVGLFLPATKVQ